MKIKISITLIFVTASIILLSFISFIFYKTGERSLLFEIYNHLEFLSSTKARAIEVLLNQKLQEAYRISNDPEISKALLIYYKTPTKKNQSKLNFLLKKHRSKNETINLFDLEEIQIASSNKLLNKKTFSKEKIFSKSGVYSNTFLLTSDTTQSSPALLLFTPVIYQQEEIGYIGIEQDASEFISQLSDYSQLGTSGEIFMVDENRQIYLTPLRYDRLASMKKIVRNQADHELDKKILRKRNLFINADYRNEPVIESRKKINGSNWLIISKMDYKELLVPINTFRKSILFIFVSAVLISIAIGIIVANFIWKPFEKLLRQSGNLLKGDYSQRIQIKQKNELASLASIINQLVSIIENTKEDLQKSKKSTDKYLYLILHDLKNPIISLASLHKMFNEEHRDSIKKEGQDILDMQQAKIIQLNQLIKGLEEVKTSEAQKTNKIPLTENKIVGNEI